MRVVLVGFGPFPGMRVNPSAVLVEALGRRRRPAFAEIVRTAHVLDTVYGAVDRALSRLQKEEVDIVIMFGAARRRRHLCIETRARNAVSVLVPDASGYRPQRSAIAPGKPTARKARAPFEYLLGAVRTRATPARLSCDAGRYVCNYAYWRALEHAAAGRPLIQFIHIPPVHFTPRPRSRRRVRQRLISFPRLIVAAEKLLMALIVARRRRLLEANSFRSPRSRAIRRSRYRSSCAASVVQSARAPHASRPRAQ